MGLRTLIKYTSIAAILLLQTACVVEVHSDNHGRHISKVFGGIDVDENEVMGDIESVNGGIVLRDDSEAEDVATVNGSIRMYDNVTIRSAETVNGSIKGGSNLQVDNELSTVNGSITLRAGTEIRDTVSTVNGSINLARTTVDRDIETVNGDVFLTRNSIVAGDVIFNENGRGWNMNNKPPKLVVEAGSEIRGEVHLYRKVRLEIDDDAEVGEIIHHY